MAKFSLVTALNLDPSGFNSGLDRAKKSTQVFQTALRSISGFLGPILGTAGALSTLKSSIESVEGPGDAFEAIIKGGKEALFEFQRALGTMDFSGLINNLIEGYKRGKEFAELMDELKDKQAYTDYLIIGWEQEAEALREIIKNKTLELSVRADAAEKIKALEYRILERRKEILQDTYDIEKESWEGRNKMTIEEGVKLFETMNSITKTGYNDVNGETIKQIQDLFDETVKAYQISGIGLSKAIENTGKLIRANIAGEGNLDFIKNIPKEDLAFIVDQLEKITAASKGGEADIWVKLFDVINKKTTGIYQAQVNYNSAVKETTTLINKENVAQEKGLSVVQQKEKAAQSLAATYRELFSGENLLTKTGIENLSLPSFGIDIDTSTLALTFKNVLDPVNQFITDWNAVTETLRKSFNDSKTIWGTSLMDLRDKLSTVMQDVYTTLNEGIRILKITLIEGLAELAVLGKDAKFGQGMLLAVANFMSQLGAAMIPLGAAVKALKKLFKTPTGAIIAGIGLIAAGAALKALVQKYDTKLNKMADGGIVSGPTLALIGEYSSASIGNPEVVAPLNKLKDMLGEGSNGGEVTFRIEGDTLVGVLNNYNRRSNSYR